MQRDGTSGMAQNLPDTVGEVAGLPGRINRRGNSRWLLSGSRVVILLAPLAGI